MDVKETSAMTETSGLVDDPDSHEDSSGADQMERRGPTVGLSEQLRKATLVAPLSSLFVAFLLGLLVARRR